MSLINQSSNAIRCVNRDKNYCFAEKSFNNCRGVSNMEKIRLTVLSGILAMTVSFTAFGVPTPERILADPPPRRISIASEATIPGFVNGKNFMEIVVPEGSARVVHFAADELKSFLKQSLGADVPVVRTPTDGMTSIILGDNELSRKEGLDVSKIQFDGFLMKSSGNRICIAGVDDPNGNPVTRGWGVFFQRGTLSGVYDFLERFIGVRFYMPVDIGIIVPKHNELKFPQMDISERPDFPRRRVGQGPDIVWFPEYDKNDSMALSKYWYPASLGKLLYGLRPQHGMAADGGAFRQRTSRNPCHG